MKLTCLWHNTIVNPTRGSSIVELVLHVGTALKSWLYGFLSSCLRRLKISEIQRRALIVAIPNPMNPG